MLRLVNGVQSKRAADIAERNVFRMMHELLYDRPFVDTRSGVVSCRFTFWGPATINRVWIGYWSWDSADGIRIETGYGLDDRGVGVRVPVWPRIFSSALGSTQWVPGALSQRVKRQVREADRSPPATAEVKKMWIYTSTPPYVFMAWCLIS
jgi:hypothetical protein